MVYFLHNNNKHLSVLSKIEANNSQEKIIQIKHNYMMERR